MIVIPTVATEKASAKFVFTHFNTDNGEGISSKLYIFVLGLLMSQYTLSGYDASAHMVSLSSSSLGLCKYYVTYIDDCDKCSNRTFCF